MGDEGHWWYLPYAGLVTALPVAGAYGGGRRRRRVSPLPGLNSVAGNASND
jgi:hypothetical protein